MVNRANGANCRLTVLKWRWSLSSSPLTAPNWYVSGHCMISVWQVISDCVDARPCNDFVVLRRVRNCLYIIIIETSSDIFGGKNALWHASFFCDLAISESHRLILIKFNLVQSRTRRDVSVTDIVSLRSRYVYNKSISTACFWTIRVIKSRPI